MTFEQIVFISETIGFIIFISVLPYPQILRNIKKEFIDYIKNRKKKS